MEGRDLLWRGKGKRKKWYRSIGLYLDKRKTSDRDRERSNLCGAFLGLGLAAQITHLGRMGASPRLNG